ncbi:MAG: MATE family efflux transporter [Lachnospiraceae bacterium]|nr:MATE family efflux transporter [Lachnospiraceae bacterium]
MADNNKIIRDMTVGSPLKQLLIFSYPLVLANLLQQAYNMADMLIVGRYVGSAGLTAISSAGELSMFFFFTLSGFASAGQIILAQHVGANRRDKINSSIGTLLSLLVILGLIMTVLALIYCDGMLHLLNIPDEAFQYAHEYAMVCFLGLIPVCGYNAVGSILRGMGDSRHPLIFIAVASILNIVLDLAFIKYLGMGPFGAALATVISQAVSFIVSIIFMYRNKESLHFDFKLKSFIPVKADLKGIFSMGFPLALQMATIVISMLYVNACVNGYGVVAAAATAVGNKLSIVSSIIVNALAVAGASIVGQNFAAGKHDRVIRTLRDILIFSLGFCAILSAIFWFFPEQLFGLFDPNPDVIAWAKPYAPIAALYFLGSATRGTAMGLINGVGNSKLAFVCGFIDGIVARVGFCTLFGVALSMGLTGYWLGNAMAGQVFGIIGLFYFISGAWKKRKLLVK